MDRERGSEKILEDDVEVRVGFGGIAGTLGAKTASSSSCGKGDRCTISKGVGSFVEVAFYVVEVGVDFFLGVVGELLNVLEED